MPDDNPGDHGLQGAVEVTILAKLEAIDARTLKMEEMLLGNGRPENGIVVRLDRMEQTELARKQVDNRRQKMINLILGGVAIELAIALGWVVMRVVEMNSSG